MKTVVASGYFDDLRSRDVRFLEEAARLGKLYALLWSDQVTQPAGKKIKFPQEERLYFLEAIRYVDRVTLISELPNPNNLPPID